MTHCIRQNEKGEGMDKLKVLDLFSGIGGFTFGLDKTGGFQTIAFVEINPKRQVDLRATWPGIPIFTDVAEVSPDKIKGKVHVVTGGFPCQDISIAGRRQGINGARSGLFYEVIRILCEFRPLYVILENSADLLTGKGGVWARSVFGALAEIGYDAEWHVIPGSGLGAPHDRERLWIIASDASSGIERSSPLLGRRFTSTAKAAKIIAYDYRERELQSGWSFRDQRGRLVYDPFEAWSETWLNKLSQICSVDDGIPRGLSAQAAARFGNTVIPHIPELIGRAILEERAAA